MFWACRYACFSDSASAGCKHIEACVCKEDMQRALAAVLVCHNINVVSDEILATKINTSFQALPA